MNQPAPRDAIRRLIGAAFDAGINAAARPASTRMQEKIRQQDYADTLIEAWIDAALRERTAPGGAA